MNRQRDPLADVFKRLVERNAILDRVLAHQLRRWGLRVDEFVAFADRAHTVDPRRCAVLQQKLARTACEELCWADLQGDVGQSLPSFAAGQRVLRA